MPTKPSLVKWTNHLWLMASLIPGVYVCAMSLGAGEFWWTDESRHAMNGVFILDFLRDLPWRAPLDYALRYFAQYPALALNWYPPGFYVIEALSFQVFGLSETSGHLTMLAFVALGLGALCVWAREHWGQPAAFIACMLVALSPQFVLWGRSVMLDVPATAMAIVSAYLFDRYLARPGWRTAAASGIALAAMLLLKQSTVFLLPALLGYAWLTGRGRLMMRRESVGAGLLTAAALGILVVHALKFGGNAVASAAGSLHEAGGGMAPSLSLARWTLFPRTVLEQLGWPFVLTTLAGAWVTIRPARRAQDVLILLWLASWYLMATLLFAVPGNAARYTIYALPALAVLACRSAYLVPKPAWRYGAYGLLLVIAIWRGLDGFNREPLFVSGYREAAQRVLAQPQRGTVLFAGKHDGNFIFHLRANDPERRQVVIRADKTLVTITVHKYFGMQSHVGSIEEVQDLLDRYKVAWVVLERPDIVGVKEFELLWQVVNGPGFHLELDNPVRTNVPEYRGLHVLIFRRLEANTGPGTVRIPVMDREVEFRL